MGTALPPSSSDSFAGSAEVLSAWADGRTDFTSYLARLAAAVLGNVDDGVSIVALLNFGQVHGDGRQRPRDRSRW